MAKWFFLFSFLLFNWVSAETQCGPKSSSLIDLKQTAKINCENIKKSSECQSLYEKIKEDGNNPAEKELRCDLDSELTVDETVAVSYMACLKGGIVGGIIAPVNQLGKWMGETTAKAIISLQKDAERQKFCDLHPEQKQKMYSTFNQSVPKLLRIDIPANLAGKSCAQIEADIYHATKLKQRVVSNRVDHKNFQKNPTLSNEEKEYLKFKFHDSDFAKSRDASLMDLADRMYKQYNISIQCYNLEARAYLRCEALFALSTVGLGIGKTALSVASGLKVQRFTSAAKTLEAGAGTLKNISEIEKIKILKMANKLNDPERIKAAEKLLGQSKPLSGEQQEALLSAHKVPLNNLREKVRILKGKNRKPGEDPLFDQNERMLLMRTGITGEFDDYLKATAIAQAAEIEAYSNIDKLEKSKIELLGLKKKGELSKDKIQEVDQKLADIENKIAENRETIIGGDVIGPGTGPNDLARIDRRIGSTTINLEIAEANNSSVTALLVRRAKLLKESGEFMAMGKSYTTATKSYDLAAQDIVKALEKGGLKNYDDQVQALRILANVHSDKYSDAYQTLASQISRSRPNIDPAKIELSSPAVNPVVSNQQRNSVWEAVREYRDQKMRIEIQRSRYEDIHGHSWDKNKQASDNFDAMINKREELKSTIEKRLKDEKNTPSQIQKVLKELEIQ